MRAVQRSLLVGLALVSLVLVALAATVPLGWAGWTGGLGTGLATTAFLAVASRRYDVRRFGPANGVTLVRASLVAGVAALVAEAFGRRVPTAGLVGVAAVALALDAVDGHVARRTASESRLGAQFDMEVDAYLILVLSVHVARTAGPWVLAIGLARYLLLVAGWVLPWLRAQVPPRFWRKVVAAVQGVVLVIASAGLLPAPVTSAALLVALALLAESFGRDAWWMWRRHSREPARVRAGVPA